VTTHPPIPQRPAPPPRVIVDVSWFAVARADLRELARLGTSGRGRAIQLWLALVSEANGRRACTITMTRGQLAHRTGLGLRSVSYAMRDLAGLGLVTFTSTRGADGRNLPSRITLTPAAPPYHGKKPAPPTACNGLHTEDPAACNGLHA
jgi:DNA-binding transcriptional ArsR family regulator